MRILQIIANLGQGGAQRMMFNLATHLKRRAVEVAALSLYGPGDWELEKSFGRENLPVEYLGKRPGFDARMPGRIREAVWSFRPDIVHTHMCLHYVFPALTGHRPFGHVNTDHATLEYDLRMEHWRFLRWLHRMAYLRGVVPVAVTREIAEKVIRFNKVRDCIVIPNGIPVAEYRCSDASRRPWRNQHGFQEEHVLFVCVARLSYLKNHAMLLEAFARGPAARPQAHLLLAGDGELKQALVTRVRELKLQAKVHFLGLRGDVREVLAASDIFVLASHSEGHSLALMEAMAAGLPAVATAVGGVPDQLEDEIQGFLVKPGDCDGMAAAMVRLLQDDAERRAMARAASVRAEEHFSVTRMAESYVHLYEHILTKRTSIKSERGEMIAAHSTH